MQWGSEHEPLTQDETHLYTRVQLARAFGWTLEYIDNMPYVDYVSVLHILRGEHMQRELQKKLNAGKRKRR